MLSNASLFKQMLRIRRFEEQVLTAFQSGLLFGTTHTVMGQEANAVGVISNLAPDDIVVSNHRCHGHFLAYGGEMQALFGEIMGKTSGVCAGRGGSQHLHWRNFTSNGIQGGIVPLACGMALAEKRKDSHAICVVFIGDGTLGEGVVYESFNMASLWGLPLLFVLENNHIAQTTPTHLALAGSIRGRFEAFGIPAQHLDTSDVLEVGIAAEKLIDLVRSETRPQALIIDTVRFGAHSKGDDTRPEAEMDILRSQRDPLLIHGERLSLEERQEIESTVLREIHAAFQFALEAE